MAFEHREQGLLGVPLVPSGRHRPGERRRRNAEKGGQIQTGGTLPRPLLPSQEERDGELFPLSVRLWFRGPACVWDLNGAAHIPAGDRAQRPAADRPQQEALQRGRTPPPSGD